MKFFDLETSKKLLELECESESDCYWVGENGDFFLRVSTGYSQPDYVVEAFSPLDFLDGPHAADNCKKVFGDQEHNAKGKRYFEVCIHCGLNENSHVVDTLYPQCWLDHQIRAMQSGDVVKYITEFLEKK